MSNEIITIDVPELKTIEQSRAAQIATAFTPMSSKLAEFEEGFNEIIIESNGENGITEELTKKAKRLRLDIGKIRIETGKIKDKQKENIKLEDKAIMGVHNFLVLAVKEKEDRLSDIEKHFEKIQEEKRQQLQRERVELISQYVENASDKDLAGMDEDVWNAYYFKVKVDYEARIEAEKKAEADRLENERLDKLENERHIEILPYRQFWNAEKYDLRNMSEEDFNHLESELFDKKTAYEKEQEKIRIENERLKKEAEEKEKKRVSEEKARKEEEERAKAAEEARIQAELNKGDAEKVSDLISDLRTLQVKYTFKSKKNQKMYSDVIALLDKVVAHIYN